MDSKENTGSFAAARRSLARNTGGTKEQLDNGLKLFDREIGLRFDTQKELTQRLFEADDFADDNMLQLAFDTANSSYTNELHVEGVLKYYDRVLTDQ